MSKEFVRTIRNTTTSEPLVTNEQNDILSDTDNIYIRNKNSYFPLTKSILKVNSTDTIISVEENIDGTENNSVTLATNENKLKEYIQQYSQAGNVELTSETIAPLIEVKNGLVKNLTEDTLEIYPQDNLTELKTKVDTNESKLSLLTTEFNDIKNIEIVDISDTSYETIEDKIEENFVILNYEDNMYYNAGKIDNKIYFFNINKKSDTSFIDYELIEVSSSGTKLYVTSLTPSEVKII